MQRRAKKKNVTIHHMLRDCPTFPFFFHLAYFPSTEMKKYGQKKQFKILRQALLISYQAYRFYTASTCRKQQQKKKTKKKLDILMEVQPPVWRIFKYLTVLFDVILVTFLWTLSCRYVNFLFFLHSCKKKKKLDQLFGTDF